MALFIERFDVDDRNVDDRTMTLVNVDAIKSVSVLSSAHGRVQQSESHSWDIPSVLGFADRLAYLRGQGSEFGP